MSASLCEVGSNKTICIDKIFKVESSALAHKSLDAAVHVVVNFDAKVDNKDDNELLQEWHQRLRQPRIDKDEASKQPCQDISSRAVAPPAGSGEAVPCRLCCLLWHQS